MNTLTPERIRWIRDRLGYTQEEFAEKVGARQATVSFWERGLARPLAVYLEKLRALEKRAEKKAPPKAPAKASAKRRA